MNYFKYALLLCVILSSALGLAHDCEDQDTVHVISRPETMNLLDLKSCPNTEILMALPKDKIPKRISLVVKQEKNSFIIQISDREKVVDGTFYNFNNVSYGGRLEVGESFRMNGDVIYDKKTNYKSIVHNQEFALYKLDINRLTLVPTFHQYASFMSFPGLDYKSLSSVQPSSFGVFLKKQINNGRDFRIGVTAGPALNITSGAVSNDYKFTGAVNLRLTIPL